MTNKSVQISFHQSEWVLQVTLANQNAENYSYLNHCNKLRTDMSGYVWHLNYLDNSLKWQLAQITKEESPLRYATNLDCNLKGVEEIRLIIQSFKFFCDIYS